VDGKHDTRRSFCHRIKAENFNDANVYALGDIFNYERAHAKWVITDVSIAYVGGAGVSLTLQIMPNSAGVGVYWFPVLLTGIASDKHKFSGLYLPIQTTEAMSTLMIPVILGVAGYAATDDVYITLSGWVED
jgi:hypothetical protein